MIDRTHQILDVLQQMDMIQAAQQDEGSRLKARIQTLEERSRALYEIVSHDNNDHDNRKKLEETEDQLHQARQRLQKLESESKEDLRKIRQQVFDMRNDELSLLESETRDLRQRRLEIQKALLPEALAIVERLREENGAIEKRLAELAARGEELNHIDMENMHKVA